MKITLIILNKHNINARLYIKLKAEELILLWHSEIIRQGKENERKTVTFFPKNDADLSLATAKALLGWSPCLENTNTSFNLPQHGTQVLEGTHIFDKLITNRTKIHFND